MSKFILKEIVHVACLVLVVSFVSFLILFLLPGSSDDVRFGMYSSIENQDSYNSAPVPVVAVRAYITWLGQFVQGDFGTSVYSHVPVRDIVTPRWTLSALLALSSLSLTLLLSLLWCFVAQVLHTQPHKGRLYARVVLLLFKTLEYILLSFIPLSLAIVVISIASALHVQLLALTGLSRYILPVIVLVLIQLPLFKRSLNISMHQAYTSPFVLFACALGYSSRWVWWREVLPNAFLFTLTLSFVQLSYLIGGTIIVEKIFLVPGLGSKLVEAVLSRDRMVVQTIVVLVACSVGVCYALSQIFKQLMYGRSYE